MNVICDNCKTKLTIPDHKLPKDKDLKLKCPKCKEQITILAEKPEKHNSDFTLENKFNALALICVGDQILEKKVNSIVQRLGFKTSAVTTTKKALKKLEYHIYPLVVVDESFDQNRGVEDIVDKLNVVDMSLRRKICLVFISSKLSTNDHMSALHTSVNDIINTDDITHLTTILPQIITEHKNLYTVYNSSLDLTGQA